MNMHPIQKHLLIVFMLLTIAFSGWWIWQAKFSKYLFSIDIPQWVAGDEKTSYHITIHKSQLNPWGTIWKTVVRPWSISSFPINSTMRPLFDGSMGWDTTWGKHVCNTNTPINVINNTFIGSSGFSWDELTNSFTNCVVIGDDAGPPEKSNQLVISWDDGTKSVFDLPPGKQLRRYDNGGFRIISNTRMRIPEDMEEESQ